jgi:hypothetical protein
MGILPKQTIDFSVPNPQATAQFSLPLYQGAGYRPDFHTWALLVNGGFMKFNLNIAEPIPVTLTLELCAAAVGGVANCPISITANGNSVVKGYRDTNLNFHPQAFQLNKNWMKAGNNEIIVSLDQNASTQMFIKAATIDQAVLPEQTIDFSVPNPQATAQFSLPLYQGAGYREDFHTWALLENGGFMKFNLNIPVPIPVTLTMVLCAALAGGKANCPFSIKINGNFIVKGFRYNDCNFHPVAFMIQENLLKAGDNEIIISLDGDASTQLFIKSATVSGE